MSAYLYIRYEVSDYPDTKAQKDHRSLLNNQVRGANNRRKADFVVSCNLTVNANSYQFDYKTLQDERAVLFAWINC